MLKRCNRMVYIGFLALGILILGEMFHTRIGFDTYRIRTTINNRVECTLSDSDVIEQEFYSSGIFNRVRLSVEVPEGEISSYLVHLFDSNGKELAVKELGKKNIYSKMLYCDFDEPIEQEGFYRIRIEKADVTKEDMQFVAKQSYGIDCYRGELFVENKNPYTRDLKMDVTYRTDRPIFEKTTSIILLVLYGMASLLLLMSSRN